MAIPIDRAEPTQTTDRSQVNAANLSNFANNLMRPADNKSSIQDNGPTGVTPGNIGHLNMGNIWHEVVSSPVGRDLIAAGTIVKAGTDAVQSAERKAADTVGAVGASISAAVAQEWDQVFGH